MLHEPNRSALCLPVAISALLAVLAAGCEARRPGSAGAAAAAEARPAPGAPAPAEAATGGVAIDPCSLALAPQDAAGDDGGIRRLQDMVSRSPDPAGALEKLGWAFVTRARQSFDPGYYKMAEASARCLEARQPGSVGALLLRGHVLHSLHRFGEAEAVARELIARRGQPSPFDHGLLGDVLLDEGRVMDAAAAYQTMVDLRPGFESFSRAAHVRWITGDVEGALALMGEAVSAAGRGDRDAVAWAWARIALWRLQARPAAEALEAAESGLAGRPGHPPCLLARGRALLAQGNAPGAVASLREAAAGNPLPEYLWALADGLRAAGDEKAAGETEARLEREGEGADPRTFALYLATRKKSLPLALSLARRELEVRADVFTHDALAWCLLASGRAGEARASMEKALSEGTQEARLFLHGARIAGELGLAGEAERLTARARALAAALLPSEREELEGLGRSSVPAVSSRERS